MTRASLLSLLFIVCMGCASAKVEPVLPGSTAGGLRFFQPAPYLLVTPTETAPASRKVTYQIIWLPDHSKEYRVHPTGFIGSSSIKVKLENGWQLTEFGIDRDSKIPDLIKEGTELGKVLGLATKQTEGLEPGLYRLRYGKDGFVDGVDRIPVGGARTGR